MDLKGTLGVRVRRALMRVPCVFHEERRGHVRGLIGDAAKIGEIQRRSRKFIKAATGDGRENSLPVHLRVSIRDSARFCIGRINFCVRRGNTSRARGG